jgi:hypothetical protein
MAVIELHTFRLADGTDEGGFLEADARAQTEFAYQQPGLVRRTTARTDEGEWLVVTLWAAPEHAEAAQMAAQRDPAARALADLIDGAGASVRRYRTLD